MTKIARKASPYCYVILREGMLIAMISGLRILSKGTQLLAPKPASVDSEIMW
jgi:hypothetical protein